AVTVRGDVDPDHGGRRARDDETARVAADDAALRGLPQVGHMRLVLLGPPGAGKGTQAHRLADRFDATLIGTGDIFRENVRGDTPLGREARSYMAKGELVPVEVVVRMVRARLIRPA